jgi:nicotinamide-nucleotide amidase
MANSATTRQHTMVVGSDTPINEHDMSKASIEIISVGNELLSGTIANTNAQWISAQITKAGGIVKRITTLGDSHKEISTAIKDSIQREPNWLILTGGLGPTYDDNTLQGLSSALCQRLKLDPRAVEMLRRSYGRHKQCLVTNDKRLNDARRKMARIPRGSIPIQNPVGSAPSIYIDVKNGFGITRIYCLPGVPKEMKALFSSAILPQIKERVGKHHFVESMFETVGVGESMLAPSLSKLVALYPSDELYLKTHPKGYNTNFSRNQKIGSKPKLNIQIVSKGDDKSQVKERYDAVLGALREEIHKLGGKISLIS